MRLLNQLLAASTLLSALTPGAWAQSAVGYGALAGGASVSASGVGKATGQSLERLGAAATASPAATSAGERAELPEQADADAASVVLRASWSALDEHAVDTGGPAVSGAGSGRTSARTSRSESTDPPASLRRGSEISAVIADLGKPTLIIQGLESSGYDRKYIFRGARPGGLAVLTLGGRIVDWSRE